MRILNSLSIQQLKIQDFDPDLKNKTALNVVCADIETLKIRASDDAALNLTMKQWQSAKKKE